MTTSNHIYAGAVLAMAVQHPVIAMVAALGSHFLLDALPHYGRKGEEAVIGWFRYKATWVVEGLNVIGVPLLVYLLWGQPWWVFGAALLAIVPDAVWIFRYFRYERHGIQAPKSLITRVHNDIQWGERPWGAFVEVACFGILIGILVKMVY